jgi:hypothetical protein
MEMLLVGVELGWKLELLTRSYKEEVKQHKDMEATVPDEVWQS